MFQAIANSLCRLVGMLRGHASPSGTLYPILPGSLYHIDFSAFKRGIDNVHIDVSLSPNFKGQVQEIVAILLEQEMGQIGWGRKGLGPSRQQWEEFRTAYARMLETVIHRAKAADQPVLLHLAQIGAIKYMIQHVMAMLDQMRQNLKGAMKTGGDASDRDRMELTERLAWLAKHRARLRYRVTRQLFAQLIKAEEGPLGELRHSLLGEQVAIPMEMWANPLLYGDGPLDEEVLLNHYVFIGPDADEWFGFPAVEQVLAYAFRHKHPENPVEADFQLAEYTRKQLMQQVQAVKAKLKRAGNGDKLAALEAQKTELETKARQATTEYKRCRSEYLQHHFYAWADLPSNVDTLFNVSALGDQLHQAKKQHNKDRIAMLKHQMHFQKRLVGVVERRFDQRGLIPKVAASYQLGALLKDYGSMLTTQELHRFVSSGGTATDLLEKVKAKQAAGAKTVSLDNLLLAAKRVRSLSCRGRQEAIIRFLKDFVTYRRDLKNFEEIQRALDQVQLQEDAKALRLSRANNTLYEFIASNEAKAEGKTIISHTILKADVRGSTTMVKELRKRNLNPASHFSLNFFDPLNNLLDTYGANKVFIEGDAVILSFLEYEEAVENRLSVARACGMAKRMLGMVQAQNATSRKEGLPELELGIGVVCGNEPPAFLYDGNNPIMIADAIGKADRLSGCSWMLRKTRGKNANFYTNVDIYEIPEGDPLRGEKGEVHLRYNLNGVELDEAAFAKLKTEITLQKFYVKLPGETEPTTMYAGRYPDLKGTMHRVVVREGKIRLYDPDHPLFGEPTQNVFYEVVTNDTVLEKVDQAVKMDRTGPV